MTQRPRNMATGIAGPSVEFGPWANPVLALSLIAVWILFVVLFNGEPGVDKAVSAFFFTAKPCVANATTLVCGRFTAPSDWGLPELRQAFQILPAAVAIVVAAILVRDLSAGLRWKDARVRVEAALLATLAIGPGLIVNVLLKDHWGRPRPYSTDLFGGHLPFVPAGELTNYCHSNCSFVSGEASSIFWLLCLIPLFPHHWRLRIGIAFTVIAVLTSGLRVAFGGHYLSDVVLGGLSTLVVFSCLAVVIEHAATRRRAEAKAR
jgi:lipid A 4'-phosphatase